jgi:hypothetical protein
LLNWPNKYEMPGEKSKRASATSAKPNSYGGLVKAGLYASSPQPIILNRPLTMPLLGALTAFGDHRRHANATAGNGAKQNRTLPIS